MRTTCLLLSGAVLFFARGVRAQADSERHLLERGEGVALDVLGARERVEHLVALGKEAFSFVVEPGGLVRLTETSLPASVRVAAAGDERGVDFRLRAGEEVSVWPVRRLRVSGSEAGFEVTCFAAEPAFVIRAERTLVDGMRARSDGSVFTLDGGQRIDAGEQDGEFVVRLIADSWPGTVVSGPGQRPAGQGAPAEGPAGAVASAEPEEPVRPDGPVPPLPFLSTGWASWEVSQALPVSP